MEGASQRWVERVSSCALAPAEEDDEVEVEDVRPGCCLKKDDSAGCDDPGGSRPVRASDIVADSLFGEN